MGALSLDGELLRRAALWGSSRTPEWFVRAAHAVVAAVTAPGVDGPLYPVDMRLRPSGNKGPVAVSLAAFQRYHAQDAWPAATFSPPPT